MQEISVWNTFGENVHHPLTILLLQILTIIVSARVLGWLMVKIGQPTVIGEIMAGILLGPSLLGWIFPSFSSFLFPKDSLPNLQFLSQIGLILFMFIIGMELDLRSLRKTARDAVVISHASIIFPYFLGVVLAYFLYHDFAPNNISFTAFALFMGIAMSITAFPVLARIVQERDLTKHPVGIMAIACAAADDVTAWCILAVVIAIVKAGSLGSAFMTIGFAVGYVMLMIYLVKPLLERIAYRSFARETVNKAVIALIFSVLIGSAYLAEVIGIHALFGAFLAGVIIPSNPEFRHVLANKIEDISLVLLLPLFFVLTGLRTQVGLLNEGNTWLICGLIIMVAVTGKFLGSALAARLVGQSWKDSLTIGALMNTRGLMELVVLNIGFDLGILTPSVFSMMVIMALVTTFMTGIALDIINYFFQKTAEKSLILNEIKEKSFKLLISFGQPRAGSRLLQLTFELGLNKMSNADLTAMHLTPSADISMTEAEIFEKEGFEPIFETAENLNLKLTTHYKATNNLNNEIIQFANSEMFDLMLVGSSRPLFSNDETGGKVQGFFEGVECAIGVMIDRGFDKISKILAVADSSSDVFLFNYLNEFANQRGNNLTVLDNNNVVKPHAKPFKFPMKLEQGKPLNAEILRGYDLLLVSRRYWETIKISKNDWGETCPTILILNK